MSSKFTGGASSGSKPLGGLKSSLLWIILGIIAVIVIVWFAVKMHNNSPFRAWVTGPTYAEQLEVQKKQQVQIQSGTIDISVGQWSTPVINLDPTKRIDFKSLTDDMGWEVRLDQNNGRTHKLYPRNLKRGSHVEITNSYVSMEARATTNYQMTTGMVVWTISPTNGNAYSK